MDLTIWQLDPAQLTPYYDRAVCDALAEAGCRVRYITTHFLYDDTLPESDAFQTDYVYFRGLGHPFLVKYPRLRRVLRALLYPVGHFQVWWQAWRQRPDIVHIQWSRLPRLDVPLIQRIKALGIPVVHTVHDVIPLFALESGADPLKAVYELADGLIVHTEANAQDFLKIFPDIPAERLHRVPMIETPDHYLPADASKAAARKALNLPPDVPIFLFFGSIRYYKGVDILLEAFKRAHTERPDIHLVIAGKADPLEKGKIPSLEALRAQPNLHLYEGFIPHGDVWMYHLAADAIVFPYRHIYQSAALITAMGFGRAVIVTDVGGMPETIDENGWVISSEDSDALAQTMLEAASDMSRLERMGQRSIQIIQQHHASKVVADALLSVYNKLLGK